MNRRHDTDEKIQADAVASLESDADGFAADPRDTGLAVGLVGERVVDVVRQLTVNADWLQAVQHGFPGTFEHKTPADPKDPPSSHAGPKDRPYLVTVTRLTSMRVTGSSPFSGTASIFSITSMPETTRPNTVYLPSSDGVRASTTKNELLALAGSSPSLAIDTMPRSCGVGLNSGCTFLTNACCFSSS